MAAPSSVAASPAVQARRWAQNVKATAAEEGTQGLRPAKRGERLSHCVGQVLVMLRHYGWIAPLSEIDHPDVYRNGGRIYVAADDIEGGASLRPGDQVSFFLYVDDQGLGAEDCSVAHLAPGSALPAAMAHGLSAACSPTMTPTPISGRQGHWSQRPTLALSASATEFVPSAHARADDGDNGNLRPLTSSPEVDKFGPVGTSFLNPSATEFVPVQATSPAARMGELQVAPLANCGLDVLKFNAACFSDSEDESEGGAEAGDECSEGFGEYESEEEEFSANVQAAETLSLVSYDSHVEWDDELDVVVLCAPLKVPRRRAASLDGSTSASDAADNFKRVTAPFCSLSMPPGLSVLAS